MKKILRTLILLALVVTITYRVYDKQFRLIEMWQDLGEGKVIIYGPRYEQKGFIIKKERGWERYDKTMNKESTIKIEGKEK